MHTREHRDNMSAGEHRNKNSCRRTQRYIAPIPRNTGITSLRANIETTSMSENTKIASIIRNIGITSPLGNTETTPMSENTAIAYIYIYIYTSIHLSIHPYQGTPMDGEHRIRLSEHGSNYICVQRSRRRPMMRLMSNSQLGCRNHAET